MHTQSALQRNNVRVIGRGPRTLILAHGFGTDQSAWHHQVAAFQDRYCLVLFDHVGATAHSSEFYSPRRYQSLRAYAEDLLEILAELQLNDAHLVGHSVSGMVGLLAALMDPSRFRGLILLGASPRYLNEAASGYVGGFEQTDLDALYEAMASNYLAWVAGFAPLVAGNPGRPEVTEEFASTLGNIRPDIAQAVARAIFQSDHRADLPHLTVPAVILQSHDDIAVPPQVGHYLTEHLPQSRFQMIQASGHLPHLSAPDAVNDAIAASLEA